MLHNVRWRRMVPLLWNRLVASASTLPTPAGWLWAGALLAGTAAVALPAGLASGFLTYKPIKDVAFVTKERIIGATDLLHWHEKHRKAPYGGRGLAMHPALGCAIALVTPGLVEEAVFRALLLPHPAVDPPRASGGARRAFARSSLLPLAAFVVYHLANPRAQSRKVFCDVRFLGLAGVLGAACTATYWVTGGSLAAAAVVHWLPVCAWLFALGGYDKLQYGRG